MKQTRLFGSGNEGRTYTVAGIICLVLALLIAGGVLFYDNRTRQTPVIFSNYQLLQETWSRYKVEYLEPGTGRTLDKQRGNVTTSEGESYTMLRAVWQDDQQTFDTSWNWTKDNLRRPNDHLSSWLFGERPDGSYGVVTEQGGTNNATDGDTDLAMALLFAASRWNRADYLDEAKAIIDDIWAIDVVPVQGKPVLTADNMERNSTTTLAVNPSYFAPYAYRMFAVVDPAHDWNGVIDSSYDILNRSTTLPTSSMNSIGLPPDWLLIDRATGELSQAKPPLTDTYGYDAMRIPWRIGLDAAWNNDPRAKQTLAKFSYLATEWSSQKSLASIYRRDGTVEGAEESPAMYGTSIGYFASQHPDMATEVFDMKLKPLYSAGKQGWATKLGYYDDNWAWFGIALYQNALPNLFKPT